MLYLAQVKTKLPAYVRRHPNPDRGERWNSEAPARSSSPTTRTIQYRSRGPKAGDHVPVVIDGQNGDGHRVTSSCGAPNGKEHTTRKANSYGDPVRSAVRQLTPPETSLPCEVLIAHAKTVGERIRVHQQRAGARSLIYNRPLLPPLSDVATVISASHQVSTSGR